MPAVCSAHQSTKWIAHCATFGFAHTAADFSAKRPTQRTPDHPTLLFAHFSALETAFYPTECSAVKTALDKANHPAQ